MIARGRTRAPARRRCPAELCLGVAMVAAGCAGPSGSTGATDSGLKPVEAAESARVRRYDPVLARERWSYAGQEGWLLTTPNYRIFTTETGPLVLDRVPAFLELAMAQYSSALADLPEPGATRGDRLETYILASRRQWELLTRQLTGDRATTYLKLKAGGFAERGRALLFNIGARHTFSVAAHEGWHQYTQRVFEHPLPIWLEEGVAAYMEGYRWNPDAPARPIFLPWANVERFDRLRELVADDRIMPLDELLASRPQDLLSIYSNDEVLDFYAQVWALTHFLSEGAGGAYRAGLEELLRDASRGDFGRRLILARGRREAMSFFSRRIGALPFEVYLDEDLERASERYERFVRKIVRTGARDRIVVGRSPVALP